MSMTVVGIGELDASARTEDVLKTVGLGSCVAVIVTDPVRRVAGLAHVVLPKSAPDESRSKPAAYFADVAIPELLARMRRLGTGPKNGPLGVKLVGGAQPNPGQTSFNIGKRNILAVKRALWQHGLTPTAEDVGGHISRTVTVKIGTSEVTVTSPSREERTL